jgi:hypothetical protein
MLIPPNQVPNIADLKAFREKMEKEKASANKKQPKRISSKEYQNLVYNWGLTVEQISTDMALLYRGLMDMKSRIDKLEGIEPCQTFNAHDADGIPTPPPSESPTPQNTSAQT